MITDVTRNYRKIVSELNTANSESEFCAALDFILPELVSVPGCEGGVVRLASNSGKADLNHETRMGAAKLCFEGLAASNECVCFSALSRQTPGAMYYHNLKLPFCCELGFRSVVVSPIPVDGDHDGLFLTGWNGDAPPDDDTLEFITAVCGHIGETANRVLHNILIRKRAEDLETIHMVGRLITAKLTLKEMVREIVARLGHVLETDEVNVILFDEARRELKFLASYFADGSNLRRPEVYPLSDGINSWIIKNRRPLLMTYDTAEECAKMGIRHGGRPAKSWLGAPMLYKDIIMGVLSVQSYDKTGLYDEHSTELLNIVAGQCAVAVENARLYEEALMRETEKERLYFSLTHDLLSLVNPIGGFARLLKSLPEDTPRDRLAGFADNIISSCAKMTRFVEDILVHAKIKSGKLALNIARADLMRVAESVLNLLSPELAMRRLEVTLNGAAVSLHSVKVRETLDADFDFGQMERVFLNIVGNAVKHARSRIDLDMTCPGREIMCRIKDDGDGVSEDHLPSLFEEFYQAGVKNRGVGLGLPTVKRIIELHHGAITADSQPGAGFAVEFSWPRTLADRKLSDENGARNAESL